MGACMQLGGMSLSVLVLSAALIMEEGAAHQTKLVVPTLQKLGFCSGLFKAAKDREDIVASAVEVWIDVTPNDVNGLGGGTTPGGTSFMRRDYNPNTTLSATASTAAPDGTAFHHWETWSDYITTYPTGQRTITYRINDCTFLVAIYSPGAVQTSTLLVQSDNPNSGVGITLTRTDNDGQGNGSTPMSRTYNSGTSVTLTAPATASGNTFSYWDLDGANQGANTALSVTMNANRTAKAVYSTPTPVGTVTVGGGASGSGSSGNPFNMGGIPHASSGAATLRLNISGLAVSGLTCSRVSGSANFSTSGLASGIGAGSYDDFAVSYSANSTPNVAENATFTIDDGGGPLQSISFYVRATPVLDVPPAPTGVAASDGTYTDKIHISWSASTRATGYRLYRSTSNNSSVSSPIQELTGLAYDDASAVPGQIYYYWVKAGNAADWSGYSNPDSGYARAIPVASVSLVSGATGSGSSGSPYDLGSAPRNTAKSATLRVSITGTTASGLTVARTSGSANFSVGGLASSITAGSYDDFTVTYSAVGSVGAPENATFVIAGSGELAPVRFYVRATTQRGPVVSGSARTGKGAALAGTTLSFSDGGGAAATDANGQYLCEVPYNWSGRITPAKSGYSFVPPHADRQSVVNDASSVNFTGTRPPATPQNISPANDAQNVPVTPTLIASAFADPDKDNMSHSYWDIFSDSDCQHAVWLWQGEAQSCAVPKGALQYGQRYYWRVRYHDDAGAFSEYSTPTAFTVNERDACGVTMICPSGVPRNTESIEAHGYSYNAVGKMRLEVKHYGTITSLLEFDALPNWRSPAFALQNGPNQVTVYASSASGASASDQTTITRVSDDSVIRMTDTRVAHLTAVGNTLFFTLSDTAGRFVRDQTELKGCELWKTDGNAAGTAMVKDINPGMKDSSPANLTDFNGILLFSADDGVHGIELWRSDGTEYGTYMIKDIASSASSSNPRDLVTVGQVVYFTAYVDGTGRELWRTDGTEIGTYPLTDIAPPSDDSLHGLCAHNGKIYFVANGSDACAYVYDPATSMCASLDILHVDRMLSIGGQLYMVHSNKQSLDSLGGGHLGAFGTIGAFVECDGQVYFRTSEGLYVTDGLQVSVPAVVPATSHSEELIAFNGMLIFPGYHDDCTGDEELWKYDVERGEVALVKDIYGGFGGHSSQPSCLTSFDGRLFLAATAYEGRELFVSDGSEAGTQLVYDYQPALEWQPVVGLNPRQFAAVGGALYFIGGDSDAALYKYTTTPDASLAADFTATPEAGSVLLTSQFRDTSRGTPNAWEWDFGDGTPRSSEQHPSHVYTTPGSYSAKLTIRNGTASAVKSSLIVVNAETDPATLPIILVHGIMGSDGDLYKRQVSPISQDKLIWAGWPGVIDLNAIGLPVPIWNYNPFVELIEVFVNGGYPSPYVCLYDWRQPCSFSAHYLTNTIAMVQRATGQQKVIVIAHSMGGLVARAAIQELGCADIYMLLMLGTPNQGCADAFYMQTQGLLAPPASVNGVFSAIAVNASFIEPLRDLHERSDYHSKPFCYFLHRYCPSISDLLSVDTYLTYTPAANNLYAVTGVAARPIAEMTDVSTAGEHSDNINEWLTQLNAQIGVDALLARCPRITIFASDDLRTRAQVAVAGMFTEYWQNSRGNRTVAGQWQAETENEWLLDGMPYDRERSRYQDDEDTFANAGDGTVLAASTAIKANGTAAPAVVYTPVRHNASHLMLPAECAPAIFKLITGTDPALAGEVVQGTRNKAVGNVAHEIVFSSPYGTDICVSDQAGHRVGVLNGVMVDNMDNGVIASGMPGAGQIIIIVTTNPVSAFTVALIVHEFADTDHRNGVRVQHHGVDGKNEEFYIEASEAGGSASTFTVLATSNMSCQVTQESGDALPPGRPSGVFCTIEHGLVYASFVEPGAIGMSGTAGYLCITHDTRPISSVGQGGVVRLLTPQGGGTYRKTLCGTYGVAANSGFAVACSNAAGRTAFAAATAPTQPNSTCTASKLVLSERLNNHKGLIKRVVALRGVLSATPPDAACAELWLNGHMSTVVLARKGTSLKGAGTVTAAGRTAKMKIVIKQQNLQLTLIETRYLANGNGYLAQQDKLLACLIMTNDNDSETREYLMTARLTGKSKVGKSYQGKLREPHAVIGPDELGAWLRWLIVDEDLPDLD